MTILDAAIGSIGPLAGGGFEVVVRPDRCGDELRFEVDEVIAATGFVAPILDLPVLGVTTFGQAGCRRSRRTGRCSCPGRSSPGRSARGASTLKKHGLPSNSGAVHGADTTPGSSPGASRRRSSAPRGDGAAVDRVRRARGLAGRRAASSPELPPAGVPARVASLDPTRGPRDEGVVPLAAFLDATGDEGGDDRGDLEADGSGAIYLVVYSRRGGRMDEVMFDPDPLLRYDTPAVRQRLADLVKPG